MMDKVLFIQTERDSYTPSTSLGKMSMMYDGKKEYFGNTLEDPARPGNVKIYGETCLPGGLECDVSLFENPHFGKTIIFHTEADGRTIKFGPLTWVGCLAHGGNDAGDTLGCVLIAANRIDKDHIQGSLKDKLRAFLEQKIKEGYTIKARFINLNQIQ